jgi:hypothetical protein
MTKKQYLFPNLVRHILDKAINPIGIWTTSSDETKFSQRNNISE